MITVVELGQRLEELKARYPAPWVADDAGNGNVYIFDRNEQYFVYIKLWDSAEIAELSKIMGLANKDVLQFDTPAAFELVAPTLKERHPEPWIRHDVWGVWTYVYDSTGGFIARFRKHTPSEIAKFLKKALDKH